MPPRPGPEIDRPVLEPALEPALGKVEPPRELGRRSRILFTVLWCSFLAAAVATMITFALVDPMPIAASLPWAGLDASRTSVYSLGFFYYWAICAVAGALTAFMLSTPVAEPPTTRGGGARNRSLP